MPMLMNSGYQAPHVSHNGRVFEISHGFGMPAYRCRACGRVSMQLAECRCHGNLKSKTTKVYRPPSNGAAAVLRNTTPSLT